MGLAYLTPMTVFELLVLSPALATVTFRRPICWPGGCAVYRYQLRQTGSPVSGAGSAYTYAQKSINPHVGFMVAGHRCWIISFCR